MIEINQSQGSKEADNRKKRIRKVRKTKKSKTISLVTCVVALIGTAAFSFACKANGLLLDS